MGRRETERGCYNCCLAAISFKVFIAALPTRQSGRVLSMEKALINSLFPITLIKPLTMYSTCILSDVDKVSAEMPTLSNHAFLRDSLMMDASNRDSLLAKRWIFFIAECSSESSSTEENAEQPDRIALMNICPDSYVKVLLNTKREISCTLLK